MQTLSEPTYKVGAGKESQAWTIWKQERGEENMI